MAVDMAEDESFPLSRAEAVERVSSLLADPPEIATGRGGAAPPLTVGLPASPGVASGPIVTNPEAAVAAADEGRAAILVRAETSPDDVHGMAKAAGILTSRGGLASHAAVVARGWGIPAVVGASGIEVRDGEVVVGDRTLKAGEVVTIDGSTGEVFEGTVAGATEPMPEARTLLEWAEEHGIAIGGDAAAAREARRDRRERAIGRFRRGSRGYGRRLRPRARDQGPRPGRGGRRFRPLHAGRGPHDPGPARRRWTGRIGRRRLQADRVRHEPGGRRARQGTGGVGQRNQPPPRSMRSWTSTTE